MPSVKRSVVIHHLRRADTLFANQQDEGRRLSDFPGKFRRPQAAGPEALRGKEYLCVRILAPERAFEARHESGLLRIVAEEPTPHPKSPHPRCALGRVIIPRRMAAA